LSESIQRLKNFIQKSKEILVFTGAGISTESGISDYRSKGGLWERFQPVTIQEFQISKDKRKEYWLQKKELYDSFENVKPNMGHCAIVALEKQGKLKGVITQNIDGLHQEAGNSLEKVLEIHGTNRTTICLSCHELTSWQETARRLKSGEEIPLCHSCGGLLKPNTISFGQNLNPKVLDQALEWSYNCDLMIALGSTLIVEPAASLPRTAKEQGAWLVIITKSETPLDGLADLKIEDSIGETLQKVMEIE
jgi:NAD-dependent deacetylase